MQRTDTTAGTVAVPIFIAVGYHAAGDEQCNEKSQTC